MALARRLADPAASILRRHGRPSRNLLFDRERTLHGVAGPLASPVIPVETADTRAYPILIWVDTAGSAASGSEGSRRLVSNTVLGRKWQLLRVKAAAQRTAL